MENKNELKYIYAFSLIPSVGPSTFRKISTGFTNFEVAWKSTPLEFTQKTKLRENLVQKIFTAKAKIDPEQGWRKFENTGLSLISFNDKNYPSQLKEVKTPPFVLFCLGSNLKLLQEKQLAIVGARKNSPYGQMATEKIVTEIAPSGLVITSGLAYGIDQIAHRTALKSNAKTIAVLGSGINEVLNRPPIKNLIDEIISKDGLIISEYPPRYPSSRFTFPARNRIVSGLSLGTLVVEAGEKSGALITTRCALEQNREVFAVPGNIFSPTSIGPNNLIKQGAQPINSANDILETFNFATNALAKNNNHKKISLTDETENKVYSALSFDPLVIDQLAKKCTLDTATISTTLSMLELRGLVQNIGGGRFVKK
ncbi:MAG TPA: DNA-protecting protein DprA [Candidatus Moranbacteria bacterium]|nr:DNA-protecting protein DprA [Candidatus Moranbacteria bacterium]